MTMSCRSFKGVALVATLSFALPLASHAEQVNDDEINKKIEALQSQVTALSSEVQQASEWKNPNTLVHLAGYADVGYVKPENEDGSFVCKCWHLKERFLTITAGNPSIRYLSLSE